MDRFGLRDWLYRLANELHDGPDAHLESKLKEFADEHGKPDEEQPKAPENIAWDTPKVNPQPFPAQVESLPQVTEPTPASKTPLTDEELAKLKDLLGKL